MADPTDPTTTATIPTPTVTPDTTPPSQDDLDAWRRYNEFTSQAASNIGDLNVVNVAAQQTFDSMDAGLKRLGISFTSLDSMTNIQAANFGSLITSVLGAKDAFTQLSNVDTDKLLTFSGQVSQLFDVIKKGPGTSLGVDAIGKIMDVMKKGGATADIMASALTGLKNGSVAVASAFLTSADNSLRLQNAMVQLTQQSGNAKDLFQGIPGLLEGVGDGFENIGTAMKFYTQELEHGTAALGGNQELAAKYMAEINRMPGGFKALIEPLKIGSDETNILAASIEYANGAGRKQEEVFADMSRAMAEYSVSGGDALRFSARISEVANDVGAQFKDVQSVLGGVVDEFKSYVNSGADANKMTQGMADSMRSYVSELTAVGVPAQNAVEMFKNYSTQMKNMTIGQQAFMSTMSGGPGGLRGALQVQDDLAKGNFDKLRQQAEDTIKRISGPLITREEAMKSESGSAQYVRQMQVLQQGPLGGLAKSQGDADSLIRAMKAGKVFTPEPGSNPEKTLQDTMSKGVEWQKGSYTELAKLNTNMQNMLLKGGVANLSTAQQMFTASGARSVPGGSGYGAGISPDAQERLSSSLRTVTTPAPGSDTFKQVSESVKNLPKTISEAWQSFKGALDTGNKESIQQANDKMLAAIKDQKATMSSMSDSQKSSFNTLQQAFSVAKPNTISGTSLMRDVDTTPKVSFAPIEDYARPGQRIPAPVTPSNGNNANGTPSNTGNSSNNSMNMNNNGQAVPVTLAPGSAITVNFTGVCPHCGTDIHHSTTDSTVSPQSGVRR